jgi:signal transduction histidine kinase
MVETDMRILIVEDERKAAVYLQNGLSEQGIVVDISPLPKLFDRFYRLCSAQSEAGTGHRQIHYVSAWRNNQYD